MFCVKSKDGFINCVIGLPASKSICNRLLVINFLSGKRIATSNPSDAGDTKLLQNLLQIIRENTGNQSRTTALDTGNAGTVMRFLAALLAITPGQWLLTGSARMLQRPIKPLADALCSLGAQITFVNQAGFPPLLIQGKTTLNGGLVQLDAGISSQFTSALMMVAPMLKNGLTIELLGETVSESYILMTQGLMQKSGVEVSFSGNRVRIEEGGYNQDSGFDKVEPDWSAAAFWYEITAIAPNASILLKNLRPDSLQGDSVLPLIFEGFGIKSTFSDKGLLLGKSGKPPVKDFSYDFTDCPDLAQAVAVTCAALGVKAELAGLKSLRVKETDRIEALKCELSALGYGICIERETIFLDGKSNYLKNRALPVINTYNDHRMAMSFAPLAILTGKICLDDPQVVEKSYPHFWDDLVKAGFNVK